MSAFIALYLDLTHCRVLIAGGGTTAHRKLLHFLDSGACITVVAPYICHDIQRLAQSHDIRLVYDSVDPNEVQHYDFVVCATSDEKLNMTCAQYARKHKVWCVQSGAGVQSFSNMHIPCCVRTGPLSCAISTSGLSPLVAQDIKRDVTPFVSAQRAYVAQCLSCIAKKLYDNFPGHHNSCKRQDYLRYFHEHEELLAMFAELESSQYIPALQKYARL